MLHEPADKREVIQVESAEQLQQLIDAGHLFIKAGLSYCSPCHRMEPVLESVASEAPCTVAEVTVDEVLEAKSLLNVRGVPLFVYMKDGRTVRRRIGEMTAEQLKEMWKDA